MTTVRRTAAASVIIALALLASVAPLPAAAQTEYGIALACPSGSDDGHGFTDVSGVHAAGIACLVRFGIAEGRTATQFAPHDPVTRGQAASFLVRLHDQLDGLAAPQRGTSAFRDIAGTAHQDSIERLAGFQPPILTGFPDGTFRPNQHITRGQFAAVIARFLDSVASRSSQLEAPSAGGAQRFDDVAPGSAHDDPIHRLAAAGVLLGRSPRLFEPDSPIDRAQSATTIARVVGGLVNAGLLTVPPNPPPTSARWAPAPGTTWHWQLQGSIDPTLPVQAFNVDGFGTPASVVAQLGAGGRGTICYLSAGSWEDWRPDADRFPQGVLGSSNGWPGERWLDIRRLDVLGPIMTARMQMCADKGFDAVEPDNIDGAFNDTGFPLTTADQLKYNRWLAETAHRLGLSIGLKNVVEQAAQLEPSFDFAINESCFRWSECDTLTVFIDAGKAVFHVEYDLPVGDFCDRANALGLSSMRKRESLDAWSQPCWS